MRLAKPNCKKYIHNTKDWPSTPKCTMKILIIYKKLIRVYTRGTWRCAYGHSHCVSHTHNILQSAILIYKLCPLTKLISVLLTMNAVCWRSNVKFCYFRMSSRWQAVSVQVCSQRTMQQHLLSLWNLIRIYLVQMTWVYGEHRISIVCFIFTCLKDM